MDRLAHIPVGNDYCYTGIIGQNGCVEDWFCPYWRGKTKGPMSERWGQCLFLKKEDRPQSNSVNGLLWNAVKDLNYPEYPPQSSQ